MIWEQERKATTENELGQREWGAEFFLHLFTPLMSPLRTLILEGRGGTGFGTRSILH